MILVNVPAPTQRLHLDALFIKRSQHCNEHVCTRSLQIRLQFSGPPSNGCQIPAGNFSGTFFFTCFPRFDFHCWIVEPRHFLEWALETLKTWKSFHWARWELPKWKDWHPTASKKGWNRRSDRKFGEESLQRKGQLKPLFEACPWHVMFKSNCFFFPEYVCLYFFGHIWIWWIIIGPQVNFYQISVITQEQDFDWRFTITAAEFLSHSRTSLPKSSPCCFVNHISSSCGDCMTLRY